MTAKACLKSMRLRTLPLSLAGIMTGVALAHGLDGGCSCWTVATLILTAALLQILSNLSNELGDTLHGTDSAEARQGAHYSIMDGEMSVAQMKRLIAVIAGLCCLSGLAMVRLSFGTVFAPLPIAFLALGAAAIWAAMNYTMGENPYGYSGLGDIFVFIFFGLVSTLGGAFIVSHRLLPIWVLPACGMGFFSVGVLNVNNIRDMATDAATRRTVALRMGLRRARIYQTVLIASGWAAFLAYSVVSCCGAVDAAAGAGAMAETFGAAASAGATAGATGIGECLLRFVYILAAPLSALHLRGVWTREGRRLDPMLPLLVLGTFALSLLFALGAFIAG